MARSLLRPGYLVPTHFHGIPFSLRKIKSPQNPRNCVLLGNKSDVDSQRASHSLGSPWVKMGLVQKLAHQLIIWNLEHINLNHCLELG